MAPRRSAGSSLKEATEQGAGGGDRATATRSRSSHPQRLSRRPADQELRRHPPGSCRVLRLRRALRDHRLPSANPSARRRTTSSARNPCFTWGRTTSSPKSSAIPGPCGSHAGSFRAPPSRPARRRLLARCAEPIEPGGAARGIPLSAVEAARASDRLRGRLRHNETSPGPRCGGPATGAHRCFRTDGHGLRLPIPDAVHDARRRSRRRAAQRGGTAGADVGEGRPSSGIRQGGPS